MASSEDEFEERRVGEVLLAGQGQPIGQGVEHAPKFELTHHPFEVQDS